MTLEAYLHYESTDGRALDRQRKDAKIFSTTSFHDVRRENSELIHADDDHK
jgi:hypothetical protein